MQWRFKEKQGLALMDKLEGAPGLEVGNHLMSWWQHKLNCEGGEEGSWLELLHKKGL